MKIQQHSVFLQDLLRQVRNGTLLPASFQRPYVWGQEDVLALVESILRGYPIGGFLLWTPWGKADLSQVGRHRLGPIQASGDAVGTSLLLDGQNRLATMAWLAQDTSLDLPDDLVGKEQETWGAGERLVVDLALREILFVPEAEVNQGFRMPTAALLDSRIGNGVIRARWSTLWGSLSEEEKDAGLVWYESCAYAFREARVVVTDMEGATADEAKDAFLHICKVGVPMSEEDFKKSLAWAF
jgi:hypothetical protein